jgi:hypothetical protein
MAISGRGWRDRLAAECRAGRILVVANPVEPPGGGCRILDPGALALSGSLAGAIGPEGDLRFVTAAERAGRRLWTGDRPEG